VEVVKKPELVSEIAKKTQLSKADAEAALNAFVETVVATVAGELTMLPTLSSWQLPRKVAATICGFGVLHRCNFPDLLLIAIYIEFV
jgi:Bacterial DNA-binding protein